MGLQFGPYVPPVFPDPLQEPPRRDPANRLNLGPGMKVLVIGPDPIEFVQEAVQRVGPDGEVAVVTDRQEMADRLQAEKRKAASDQVATYVRSPGELPFPDDSIDRAMAARILRKPGDRQRALQELRRVLKTGGLLGVEQKVTDRGSVGPRTVKQWCTAAGFESIRQYGSPLHYVLVFWKKPQTGTTNSAAGHR